MKFSVLMILMIFVFNGCSSLGQQNAQGAKSCCEKNYEKKSSCQGGSCSLKTACSGGSCTLKAGCGSCKVDKKDCSDCKSSKNCVSSSCPLKAQKKEKRKSCCNS